MAQVTLHKEDDPAIAAAAKRARATFRYFWRELSWEYRRLIPGRGMAAFKVAFTDNAETAAEVMWVNEVDFNGYQLSGRLLNQPNWLTSINEGDPVKVPVKAITDWIYTIDDVAYGGFSVNAIRKTMGKGERKAHDEAWGLDFGDPDKVHLVPADWYGDATPKKKGGFLGFGKSAGPEPLTDDFLQTKEHPMAANMAPSLKEFAQKDTTTFALQDNGLNMLHQISLAGSAVSIKALLQCGAEINQKSAKGHTAMDFARSLGWKRAYQFLKKNGGQEAAQAKKS